MKFAELDIGHYAEDGVELLCDVEPGVKGRWLYKNIRTDLMYSNHASWIYFIVVENQIVKIGETGNPLGIRKVTSDQPQANTRCRMGRLANHQGLPDTDVTIRLKLTEHVEQNRVSIWVRRCEVIESQVRVGLEHKVIRSALNKDLEVAYLDYIHTRTGQYPELNKLRK